MNIKKNKDLSLLDILQNGYFPANYKLKMGLDPLAYYSAEQRQSALKILQDLKIEEERNSEKEYTGSYPPTWKLNNPESYKSSFPEGGSRRYRKTRTRKGKKTRTRKSKGKGKQKRTRKSRS